MWLPNENIYHFISFGIDKETEVYLLNNEKISTPKYEQV